MLLCDAHHRLIDVSDIDGHPVDLLRAMKVRHEQRIELVTALGPDRQSHVVLYGANIGPHAAPLSFKKRHRRWSRIVTQANHILLCSDDQQCIAGSERRLLDG